MYSINCLASSKIRNYNISLMPKKLLFWFIFYHFSKAAKYKLIMINTNPTADLEVRQNRPRSAKS